MSQFDGGFLETERNDYGNDRGQTHVPRSQESNTIRSITIAQLQEATSNGDLTSDVLKIDGVEVSHLILCGQIQSKDKRASNTMYSIDDTTDTCTVKHFKSTNDDLTQYQTEDEDLNEGVWCMVYGHCRAFEQEYFINAFRIRPITDHNEISFHFASCIRQHLYFTKGPLPEEVASKTTARTGTAPEQPSQQPGTGYNMEKSMDERIEEILRRSKDDGISFDEICQKLHNSCSPHSVQVILNTFVQEGRACSTTADDHYRWSG